MSFPGTSWLISVASMTILHELKSPKLVGIDPLHFCRDGMRLSMSPSYKTSCIAQIWEVTMLLTEDALVLNLSARSKSGVFIVIFINVIKSWSVNEMKDGLHPSMYLIWNLCIISSMAWNMSGRRLVYISIYIKTWQWNTLCWRYITFYFLHFVWSKTCSC